MAAFHEAYRRPPQPSACCRCGQCASFRFNERDITGVGTCADPRTPWVRTQPLRAPSPLRERSCERFRPVG